MKKQQQCMALVVPPGESAERQCKRSRASIGPYCWQHQQGTARPRKRRRMVVLCEEQRTEEWERLHLGRITASRAHIVLMARHTKTRRDYVEQLADDLQGIPNFEREFDSPYYAEGVYYEAWARGWYSFRHDVHVQQTGFVVHPQYTWIGCSPDGLIGDEGGLEIKYRTKLKTFNEYAATQVVPRAVKAQVQTSILVCDRDWWDYLNYWRDQEHEKEKAHVQRMYRDDAFIRNELLPGMVGLWNEVQEEIQRRQSAAAPLRHAIGAM